MPRELLALDYIDRFGVKAVLGRDTLGYREIREMVIAENIRTAYKSREAYQDKEGNPNWAEWARKHPDLNRFINFAMKAAGESDGE